jgi:hypothetical protein
MSNKPTITAIDGDNNVTYYQVVGTSQNTHIYFESDDEDENNAKFLIEKVDVLEDEQNETYLEEEEQFEILESVVIDQKPTAKKEIITKQLVEKKPKSGKVLKNHQLRIKIFTIIFISFRFKKDREETFI